MKAIILLCFTLAISCTPVKKVKTREDRTTDSTAIKENIIKEVIRKDSTSKEKVSTVIKTISDSGYNKTTITKEYYSDEFDFDNTPITLENPGSATHISTRIKNRDSKTGITNLIYREITVLESGNIKKNEDQLTQSNQKVTNKVVDSATAFEKSKVDLSKSNTIKIADIKKFRPSAGAYISAFIGLLIAYLIWRYRKHLPF